MIDELHRTGESCRLKKRKLIFLNKLTVADKVVLVNPFDFIV